MSYKTAEQFTAALQGRSDLEVFRAIKEDLGLTYEALAEGVGYKEASSLRKVGAGLTPVSSILASSVANLWLATRKRTMSADQFIRLLPHATITPGLQLGGGAECVVTHYDRDHKSERISRANTGSLYNDLIITLLGVVFGLRYRESVMWPETITSELTARVVGATEWEGKQELLVNRDIEQQWLLYSSNFGVLGGADLLLEADLIDLCMQHTEITSLDFSLPAFQMAGASGKRGRIELAIESAEGQRTTSQRRSVERGV